MRPRKLCWVAALTAIAACGGEDGGAAGTAASGGSGGAGGTFVPPPPTGQRTFQVRCTRDVDLQFEVVIDVELTNAFSATQTTGVSFATDVTLAEASASALIDAGISTVDIASLTVRTALDGASPSSILTTLSGVPVDDYDLTIDTDDNGEPGPHVLALEPVETTGVADAEARQVSFSVSEVSIGFGDFRIPDSCVGFAITGVPLRFPVDPD